MHTRPPARCNCGAQRPLARCKPWTGQEVQPSLVQLTLVSPMRWRKKWPPAHPATTTTQYHHPNPILFMCRIHSHYFTIFFLQLKHIKINFRDFREMFFFQKKNISKEHYFRGLFLGWFWRHFIALLWAVCSWVWRTHNNKRGLCPRTPVFVGLWASPGMRLRIAVGKVILDEIIMLLVKYLMKRKENYVAGKFF